MEKRCTKSWKKFNWYAELDCGHEESKGEAITSGGGIDSLNGLLYCCYDDEN